MGMASTAKTSMRRVATRRAAGTASKCVWRPRHRARSAGRRRREAALDRDLPRAVGPGRGPVGPIVHRGVLVSSGVGEAPSAVVPVRGWRWPTTSRRWGRAHHAGVPHPASATFPSGGAAGDEHRTCDVSCALRVRRAELRDAGRSGAPSDHGVTVEKEQVTCVVREGEPTLNLDERVEMCWLVEGAAPSCCRSWSTESVANISDSLAEEELLERLINSGKFLEKLEAKRSRRAEPSRSKSGQIAAQIHRWKRANSGSRAEGPSRPAMMAIDASPGGRSRASVKSAGEPRNTGRLCTSVSVPVTAPIPHP